MSKVKGITIEIGGDTTGLNSALKSMDKEIGKTKSELKDVDKLLKLDPSNTILLTQKQQLLGDQIKKTSSRLDALKQAKENALKSDDIDKNSSQFRQLEREIIETEGKLTSLGNEFKTAGEKAKDATDTGFTVAKGVLANLATDTIEAVISGLGKMGQAFVNVGKQSVAAFGEYEQLTGGVETLFGENADAVKGFADEAYKTAGLSANEYMSTVTGFSASLINSLGGDTAKASDYANQAIIDMADNANKMGTSIDSIQNAYQGFAKQNYTMLDNLKLGYGGTKTEMQRLLKDAEKLTGKKFDISNFADITEAIHAIQTEMGITGTTSQEASTTIEGSVNSMKGAWDNFTTALGTGSDISPYVDNLVNSFETVADNILPVIDNIVTSVTDALPRIIETISTKLPDLIETGKTVLNSLIEGITNNMPELMEAVMLLVNMLLETITENLPLILETGITILTSIIQGLTDAMPELIPTMVDTVTLIVETLLDNIDLVIDAGISLLIGLTDGLIEALPNLIDKVPEIIDKLVDEITNNLPKILQAGITLLVKLAEGIVSAIPQLVSKIPQVIGSLISGISDMMWQVFNIGADILENIINGILSGFIAIYDIGHNIVTGIFSGITNATKWLYDKILGWVGGVVDYVKSLFGIESPSKVFRDEIGINMAKGIGVGFVKGMPGVISNMKSSLMEATDNLQAVMIDTVPNVDSNVTHQNFYTTKNYSMTSEVVRQPVQVVLEIDKNELGKVVVPAYDNEKNRIGVVLA